MNQAFALNFIATSPMMHLLHSTASGETVKTRQDELIGCFKSWLFARTVLEPLDAPVDLLLSDSRQVTPFGQVLVDQAVGIFSAAALPAPKRDAEIRATAQLAV